jgi:SAM-dependent methyltransferase
MSEPLQNSEKDKYTALWQRDEYRQYSPGEVSIKNLRIIDLLRRCGVKTVLDAGCGAGKLMRFLIEQCGREFSVHGFDIAENCLDPFFDDIKNEILTVGVLWNKEDFNKEYDAIICCDVLEHIPTEKIDAVLDNFYRRTKILCYLSIALQQDYFGPKIIGKPLHLTVEKPDWWLAKIKKTGFSPLKHFTEKTPDGIETWLHVFLVKSPP